MDPRRRGNHCSRNILSLLELGSSGQDRLRVKLRPLSFWDQDASCLWNFWARSACDRYTKLLRKLKSDIRDKRPDIDRSRTSPFVTTTRVFIHLGPLHGRETCETGMDAGRWFLTRRTALIWRHPTSTCSDYWKTFSVASISQTTANWRRQWVYRPKM